MENFKISGHGPVDPSNEKIARPISVLAMALALSDTLGKSARTGQGRKNPAAGHLF